MAGANHATDDLGQSDFDVAAAGNFGEHPASFSPEHWGRDSTLMDLEDDLVAGPDQACTVEDSLDFSFLDNLSAPPAGSQDAALVMVDSEGSRVVTAPPFLNASKENPPKLFEVVKEPFFDAKGADMLSGKLSSALEAAIQYAAPWSRRRWRKVSECDGVVSDEPLVACQQYYMDKVRSVPCANIADIFHEFETVRWRFYYANIDYKVSVEGKERRECTNGATVLSYEFVSLLLMHCNNKMFEIVAGHFLLDDIKEEDLNKMPLAFDGRLSLRTVRKLWHEAGASRTRATVGGSLVARLAHEDGELERPKIRDKLTLDMEKLCGKKLTDGKPAGPTEIHMKKLNKNVNAKVSQTRDRQRYVLGQNLLHGLKQMEEAIVAIAWDSVVTEILQGPPASATRAA